MVMSAYTGKWSVCRLMRNEKLAGMAIVPSDEWEHHAAESTCPCQPECEPMTGFDPDTGDDVLGVMIKHRPFCEQV